MAREQSQEQSQDQPVRPARGSEQPEESEAERIVREQTEAIRQAGKQQEDAIRKAEQQQADKQAQQAQQPKQ